LSFCFALKTYLCLKIITDEFIANNYRTSGKTELCYKKRQQQKPLEVIELLDAGKRVAEPKGDAW
jgi:hypothetical protein